MYRRDLLAALSTTTLAGVAGCGGNGTGTPPSTVSVPRLAVAPSAVGYPYGTPAGLPAPAAAVDLSAASVVDRSTDSPVASVVSVPDAAVPTLVATTDGGETHGWRVHPDGVSTIPVEPAVPPGLPAVSGSITTVSRPQALSGGGPSGHPVATGVGFAWVRGDGALVLRGAADAAGETDATLALDALPDGRPTVAAGSVWVLVDPSTDYAHGILGDDREGTAVVAVDPVAGEVVDRRPAPTGTVIEDLWPRIVSFDDDPYVLVTASDADGGARLVALGPDGRVIAGPPVGTGFRWRHVLAVGPFGPTGQRAVAVVRTPHIGGVAEFYRRDGDRFRLVAERRGYSTHRIGERTLATALPGRWSGEGTAAASGAELLLPTASHDALAVLRSTPDGVEERSRVPLDGTLRSNLVATHAGGVVAAGTEDGLRVWVDA